MVAYYLTTGYAMCSALHGPEHTFIRNEACTCAPNDWFLNLHISSGRIGSHLHSWCGHSDPDQGSPSSCLRIFCVFLILSKQRCKIWGFHGGDYEECHFLGYKTPVRTSRETHYVSTTEPSRLMLCKIWGFHGSDYEECRLLGYKNPVLTSQETHYFSATESSQLMLVRFEVFTAVTMENAVFWDVTQCGSCKNRRFGGTHHLHHQGDENRRARKHR
jgi:hypothetical protein